MTIIPLCISCILLFLLARAFYHYNPAIRAVYWPALLTKVLAGISLGLIYTYYYRVSDTFSFFNDGVVLADLFKKNSFEFVRFLWKGDDSFQCWSKLTYHDYRSMYIVKFVSLLNILTGNNYWVTSIYFSFISFAAAWRMVQALIRYFPDQTPTFVLACLGVPTVIFWSSGVIKESMELASLFLITSVFLKFWMRDKITAVDILLVIFSGWVLWQIKYYYAAILFPVLVTTIVIHKAYSYFIKTDNAWIEVCFWFGVFVIPMLLISISHPNFHYDKFLGIVVKNYNTYQRYSRPDAVIHYSNLSGTVASIFVNAPWAFFSCMFRPFIWEATNFFSMISALENIVLFLLTLAAMPRLKDAFRSQHRLVFLSMLVYIVLLAVFLALSAPNFGTLSRFRVGLIPFYTILICLNSPLIKALANFIERTFVRLVR